MVENTEKFDDAAKNEKISVENPLICEVLQILDINLEKKQGKIIVQDCQSFKALGFLGKDIIELFSSPKMKNRLPFQISIIKGVCKKTAQDKFLLEIDYAIIENGTYINSNLIGSHAFCEMETYLKAYINTVSEPNVNLLWGNLIHEYLSSIFSNPLIYTINKITDLLQKKIIASFQRAIDNNWELYVRLKGNPADDLAIFKTNFFQNEADFILNEINQYKKRYGEFEFVCEKMMNSRNLGIQGKVDRLVRDINQKRFTVYETKTGLSSQSSAMFAYYQCMAYASMLKEGSIDQIDQLFIEYPRNSLSERLQNKEFNIIELYRICQMRNEIWNIMIGNAPNTGPFKMCGKCGSRDACEFYCYRRFRTKYCANHNQPCVYQKYYEQDVQHRSLFSRLDAYFSWFLYGLDQEFLSNQTLINEVHLSAPIREKKGNCVANLVLRQENSELGNKLSEKCPLCNRSILQGEIKCGNCGFLIVSNPNQIQDSPENQRIQQIIFRKGQNEKIQNTRLRKGDYVLITPQQFKPLTSESLPGIITELTEHEIMIKIDAKTSFNPYKYNGELFRVDLTTSNYMVNLQKQALDQLVRYSVFASHRHLAVLRNILLFEGAPHLEDNRNLKESQIVDTTFDDSQQIAIHKAMISKDLLLIQGPPGTGKTTVIVEIINRLVQNYRKAKSQSKESKPINSSSILNDVNRSNKIKQECPILITAFTNKAVDTVLLKILTKHPDMKIIRIGNIASIESEVIKQRTIEATCQSTHRYLDGELAQTIDPLKVQAQLEQAEIIATTTTSAGALILQQMSFQTVILDEAGQIVEPSALTALVKGQRWILVGDHQQLPPIMTGSIKEIPVQSKEYVEKLGFNQGVGLGLSIFERLVNHFKNSPVFVLLNKQYRMNKLICQFISQTFYKNELLSGEIKQKSVGDQTFHEFFQAYEIESEKIVSDPTFGKYFNPDQPMTFIDTQKLHLYDSGAQVQTQNLDSCFNEGEAQIIAKIITYFLKNCWSSPLSSERIQGICAKIGIISGFRAQNQKIRQSIYKELSQTLLNKSINIHNLQINNIIDGLVIDTVDRFQGQEREIIFYSFVDANVQQEIRALNQDVRRLNVAISRAKKKIIFVGDMNTLSKVTTQDTQLSKWAKSIHQQLMEFIKQHNGYYIESEFGLSN